MACTFSYSSSIMSLIWEGNWVNTHPSWWRKRREAKPQGSCDCIVVWTVFFFFKETTFIFRDYVLSINRITIWDFHYLVVAAKILKKINLEDGWLFCPTFHDLCTLLKNTAHFVASIRNEGWQSREVLRDQINTSKACFQESTLTNKVLPSIAYSKIHQQIYPLMKLKTS